MYDQTPFSYSVNCCPNLSHFISPQNLIRKAAMTLRIAARYVSRRLSSGGKVLSEEEKAAENIYIKKSEKEKLEKLAHKNAKPEEKPAGFAGSVSDTQSSNQSSTSTSGSRNYGVIAGVVTVFGALGWYFNSNKPEEVHN